jgi:hypothetical protein
MYTYGVSVTFCLRGIIIHNLDYAEPPSDAFVRTLASYDEVPVLDPTPETGQYCADGKIETNEMGRASGVYGGG